MKNQNRVRHNPTAENSNPQARKPRKIGTLERPSIAQPEARIPLEEYSKGEIAALALTRALSIAAVQIGAQAETISTIYTLTVDSHLNYGGGVLSLNRHVLAVLEAAAKKSFDTCHCEPWPKSKSDVNATLLALEGAANLAAAQLKLQASDLIRLTGDQNQVDLGNGFSDLYTYVSELLEEAVSKSIQVRLKIET